MTADLIFRTLAHFWPKIKEKIAKNRFSAKMAEMARFSTRKTEFRRIPPKWPDFRPDPDNTPKMTFYRDIPGLRCQNWRITAFRPLLSTFRA
jgi:hypothetical protein